MYSNEFMREALAFAKSLGYGIRYEWFGGSGGGSCEFNGSKWIYIDLALNAVDQCDQLIHCLRHDSQLSNVTIPAMLQRHLRPQTRHQAA